MRLLAESLLIVASVLLALAVDEWREGREVEERVETALVSFEQELEDNLAQVEQRLPYHMTLRSRFGELQQGPPPTDLFAALESIPEWRGMAIPGLLDVAWQAALAGDVLPHMDFRLITALARVYHQQGWLQTRAQQGSRALDPQNLSPENLPYTLLSTSIFLEDMIGMQRSLYCQYAEVLQLLDQAQEGGLEGWEWPEGRRDTLGVSPIRDQPLTLGC